MKKENPSKVVIVPKPTPPVTTETAPQVDTVLKSESIPEPDPEETEDPSENVETKPAPKK